MRARDLFYALWIPDLFMEKVENNEDWYLMCPHKCKGLSDVYGDEFKLLYNKSFSLYINYARIFTIRKCKDDDEGDDAEFIMS